MCIIIVKDAGAKMPDNNTIKTCWNNNPDGAGLAWQDSNGQIHISKGYQTLKAFNKALKAIDGLAACPVIMHFRIQTSGGIRPELTHPFPLTDVTDDLKASRITPKIAVAHNGVISIQGYDRTLESDTLAFIRDELAPLAYDVPRFYKYKSIMKMLESRISSKLALLTQDGIHTIGAFVYDDATGLYYSNSTYKQARKTYKASQPRYKQHTTAPALKGGYGYDYDADAYTWPATASTDYLVYKIETLEDDRDCISELISEYELYDTIPGGLTDVERAELDGLKQELKDIERELALYL